MCGNTNPDASLEFLRNNFKPNEINVKKIKRGLVSQKKWQSVV